MHLHNCVDEICAVQCIYEVLDSTIDCNADKGR